MIVNYVLVIEPRKIIFSHGINENGGVPRIGETLRFDGPSSSTYRVEHVERILGQAAFVYVQQGGWSGL